MYFMLETCLFNIKFQGKEQQQQTSNNKNKNNSNNSLTIFVLHIFSAISGSIIVEVIGREYNTHTATQAWKIHQSWISETGGT
jgi:hypothetical protein